MHSDYQNDLLRAKVKRKDFEQFLARIADGDIHLSSSLQNEIHEQVSAEVDCLACANCCKTTPALISEEDQQRIPKAIGVDTSDWFRNFVTLDEDGDWVLSKSPCRFLQDDNCCSIYEHRPEACREFPHTDDARFKKITEITLENTKICPIVVRVLERLIDLKG